VSEAAVLLRCNRILRKEDEQLIVPRGDRYRAEVGDLYIVDLNRNAIIAKHVDLDALAHTGPGGGPVEHRIVWDMGPRPIETTVLPAAADPGMRRQRWPRDPSGR
jgi:hypothetical protein